MRTSLSGMLKTVGLALVLGPMGALTCEAQSIPPASEPSLLPAPFYALANAIDKRVQKEAKLEEDAVLSADATLLSLPADVGPADVVVIPIDVFGLRNCSVSDENRTVECSLVTDYDIPPVSLGKFDLPHVTSVVNNRKYIQLVAHADQDGSIDQVTVSGDCLGSICLPNTIGTQEVMRSLGFQGDFRTGTMRAVNDEQSARPRVPSATAEFSGWRVRCASFITQFANQRACRFDRMRPSEYSTLD